MTFYKNRTSGDVVEDETGALAGLARWEPIEAIDTTPGTENEPPTELVGEPISDEDAATVPAAVVELPDGTVLGEDGDVPTLTAAPAKKPRARKPAKSAQP